MGVFKMASEVNKKKSKKAINVKHVIHNSDVDVRDWLDDAAEIVDYGSNCRKCPYGQDEDNFDKNKCEKCDEFLRHCLDLNSTYLEDELSNLNIPLENNVVAFAKLGLWNGPKSGFKVLGRNVNSIFKVSEDFNLYYVDSYNVKAKCVHHDGTNHILYRELKPNVSVDFIENFMYKHQYEISSELISRYTRSLLPYVKKVYGW